MLLSRVFMHMDQLDPIFNFPILHFLSYKSLHKNLETLVYHVRMRKHFLGTTLTFGSCVLSLFPLKIENTPTHTEIQYRMDVTLLGVNMK